MSDLQPGSNKDRFSAGTLRLLKLARMLGPAIILTLGKLCRYKVVNRQYFDQAEAEGKGVIVVLWHGRMLLPIYHHRNSGIASLVSLHKDGEFITQIVQRLGYIIHRGSPKEGGREGFNAMLKELKNRNTLAMFPDGPTGPRHSIHDGIMHLARLTSAPLIPVLFSAKPNWRAHSWDKFMIMLPFSRAIVQYGEPIYLPRRMAGEEELSKWRDLVRDKMVALEQELDNQMGVQDA